MVSNFSLAQDVFAMTAIIAKRNALVIDGSVHKRIKKIKTFNIDSF